MSGVPTGLGLEAGGPGAGFPVWAAMAGRPPGEPGPPRFRRGAGSHDTMPDREPLASPSPMSPKSRPVPEASETEWRLLSCVWDLRSANPIEVAEHLRTRYKRELSAKTVGILLGRLVEKGFLRSVTGPIPPRGRPALIYFPLVTRREALRRQFQLFFENHLIEAEEDLAFLEALIEERREQAAKNG
jgi:predicted transcriptional regulator